MQRDQLDSVAKRLAESAGADLKCVALFGSLARGEASGGGDGAMVVVLKSGSLEVLASIRSALKEAWRTSGVEPFLITADEVPQLLDVFPVKALVIQRYGEVLFGENPFASLAIDPEHLRLRAEQESRNLLSRLRHDLVRFEDSPRPFERLLGRAARQLTDILEALLELHEERPADGRRATVLAAAARRFDLDASTLAQLAQETYLDDPGALLMTQRMLPIVERIVAVADQTEVSR